MTRSLDSLQHLRAANPVPVPPVPDWRRIKDHVSRGLIEDDEAPRSRPHAQPSWPSSRVVLVSVAFGAAMVAALFAIAPWSNSPSFLARAAAALTPSAGTVLYERWEETIAAEPGNRVYTVARTMGPDQLWVEGNSPHRYRVILEPNSAAASLAPADGAGLAFDYGVDMGFVGRGNAVLRNLQRELAGGPLELGGTLEAPGTEARPGTDLRTLTLESRDKLLAARLHVALGASLPGPHDQIIEDDTDPVSALRAAIAEGRAHDAGTAQLDGRSVRRIDLDLPKHLPADAPPLPADAPVIHAEAYAYVEPETFYPVEIVFGRDSYRFLAYEYLPGTSANLALTNIQAQHPSATIVKDDAGTGPTPSTTLPTPKTP